MHFIADFLIKSIIRTRRFNEYPQYFNDYLSRLTITTAQKATILLKHIDPRRRIALWRGSFMLWNGENLDSKRFSGIEKAHRNSIKIKVDLWRRRRDSNPRTPYGCYTISNRARSAGLRDFSEYKTIFKCSACVL